MLNLSVMPHCLYHKCRANSSSGVNHSLILLLDECRTLGVNLSKVTNIVTCECANSRLTKIQNENWIEINKKDVEVHLVHITCRNMQTDIIYRYLWTHTHTYVHAQTHARTHTRTHAHCNYMYMYKWHSTDFTVLCKDIDMQLCCWIQEPMTQVHSTHLDQKQTNSRGWMTISKDKDCYQDCSQHYHN